MSSRFNVDTIYPPEKRQENKTEIIQTPKKQEKSWKYFYKSIEIILTFWVVTVLAIMTQPWLDYWVKTSIKKNTLSQVLSESTIKNQIVDEKTSSVNQPIFRLKNSAIDVSAPIVQGIDKESLKNGIGHHTDSVWPNQKGNVVLAGHNFDLDPENKYGQIFMELRKVDIGNQAIIDYQGKKYYYEVFKKETISSKDTSLYGKIDDWILTFYTCDPPYTDWKRLVFQAKLTKIE